MDAKFSFKSDARAAENMNDRQTCHIVFTGMIEPLEDMMAAENRLSKLFNMDAATARRLLSAKRTIIKRNVAEEKAREFVEKMAKANFKCMVEPSTESLKHAERTGNFKCPKCGYECPMDDKYATGEICPSCQVVVSKYLQKHSESSSINSHVNPDNIPMNSIEQGDDAGEEEEIEKESILPLWLFRLLKLGVTAIGAYIVIQTGISVFEINNYEMLYRRQTSEMICQGHPQAKYHPELASSMMEHPEMMADPANNCIKTFKLLVLNSGRKTQPQTVVRLYTPPEFKKSLAGEVMVLDFDRSQRRGVRVRIQGDTTSYAIGSMKPADQVFLRFKLLMKKDEEFGWDQVLKEIDIAKGDLSETDFPQLAFMTRVLLGAFAAFDKSTKDLTEELSDIFLEDATEEAKTLTQEFDMASADLEVSIKAERLQRMYGEGQAARYLASVLVQNHGPAEARNVELFYRIPDSVTPRSISLDIEGYVPSTGEILAESKRGRKPGLLPNECVKSGDGFACTFKTLLPEKRVFIYFDVTDQKVGASLYHASVPSDQTDPNSKNNEINYRVSGG